MRKDVLRRHSGQSMVEFAVLAPVFFMLLLGTIDLVRAVYIYNSISDAAREGARAAIPFDSPLPTKAQVAGAVQSKLGVGFALTFDPCIANSSNPCPSTPSTPNTGTIWYSSGISTPGRGSVAVKISFLLPPWIPVIRDATGHGVVISAQSTMVTEY